MNVEKFKSSSVVSFYTKLYTKKKFRVGKIEHFFKERLGNWWRNYQGQDVDKNGANSTK